MRLIASFLVASALTGCVGGGRSGPGDIPQDAFGAMYTDGPPETVATCLAQAIGGTLQASGDRFLVTSPAAGRTYDVGSNPAESRYPTEAVIRGTPNATEEQRASTCFIDPSRLTRDR